MQFLASNYTKSSIANREFGGVAFAAPATWLIKLFSNALNAAGTGGIEIGAAGYAAIAVPNNTANFPVTTNGIKTNALLVETPEITEETTVRAIGLLDENGNLRYYANLAESLIVPANTKVTFGAGQISFTVTGSPMA